MNETLLTAITVLLFLIALCFMALTVFAGIFFLKNYKNRTQKTSAPEPEVVSPDPQVLERIEQAKAAVAGELKNAEIDPTLNIASGYCNNHPHERAQAMCAICNDLLCEDCVREFETLNFCPEHFDLFIRNDWDVIETVKTTPNEAHKSFHLYDFKSEIWKNSKTATYIMTDYKIDVTSDEVESHISLYGQKESVQELKKMIKKHLQ